LKYIYNENIHSNLLTTNREGGRTGRETDWKRGQEGGKENGGGQTGRGTDREWGHREGGQTGRGYRQEEEADTVGVMALVAIHGGRLWCSLSTSTHCSWEGGGLMFVGGGPVCWWGGCHHSCELEGGGGGCLLCADVQGWWWW
jgi:hypothetical protein